MNALSGDVQRQAVAWRRWPCRELEIRSASPAWAWARVAALLVTAGLLYARSTGPGPLLMVTLYLASDTVAAMVGQAATAARKLEDLSLSQLGKGDGASDALEEAAKVGCRPVAVLHRWSRCSPATPATLLLACEGASSSAPFALPAICLVHMHA